MNSFRVRIFLSFVPAILANGCDPIDPCAEVTCDPNEVCVNGTCETVCDGDDDCAAGETCFNGVCAANCAVNDDCGCNTDADCNDQDACTSDTCAGGQVCLNTPISCNTADTCPDGCNVSCSVLSFCSNSINPCANVTCDPNEICVDGACIECFSDGDCDGGEVCFNGDCVECGRDADCGAGKVCDEAAHTCVEVECVFSNDCDDQNPCTQDTCVGQNCRNAELTCNVAADCPEQCICILIAGSGVCLRR